MYYLLQYQYGENAVERRAPHREAHLSIARELHRRGELLLGGAFAEPWTEPSSCFVPRTFRCSSTSSGTTLTSRAAW